MKGHPQTYYFDNYSVKEGLSQSKVYCILQDSLGYVWMGTTSGASNFDGLNFTNYTADDGLAQNGIRVITSTKSGTLWFGHIGGGLSRYMNKKFDKINNDSLNLNVDITTLHIDKSGNLWIGTHGAGAFKITNPDEPKPENLNFEHFAGYNKLSDRIFKIEETNDSILYFIIDGSIKYLKPNTSDFITYSPQGLNRYFQFTCMEEDKQGNLWFGTFNGGLQKLIKQSGKVITFDVRDGLASNWITYIYEDYENKIWIGTWGGGINLLNGKTLRFSTENGLPDNKIWSIIGDRENNIFIGTNENGFCIFKGAQFVSYGTHNGFIHDQINTILYDNQQNIWFGTSKGISILKSKTGKIETFKPSGNIPFDKDVVFLKSDKQKNIWIATKYDGIYKYQFQSGKLEYNQLLNTYLSNTGNGIVTAMTIDKDNALWVGTIDGLIFYNISKQQIDRVAGSEITSLFCDNNNDMWIGKKGGLLKFQNNDFVPLDTLGKITALSIDQDSNGNIWIGTEGQGIKILTPNGIVKQLKTTDGLLADLVTLILCDSTGNTWIGSSRGLNRYSTKEEKIYTYTSKIGFIGIEIKNNAGVIGPEGYCWFGTVKGAIRFDWEKTKPVSKDPVLHFTILKINLRQREFTENLKLSHTENGVYFGFNSICLTDAERVMYQFMLKGADTEWQPPTRQNFKNYSLLPPGQYTFMVKACNNLGEWSKQPLEFSFTIKPPFYKTWWFIVICISALTIIVVMVVLYREQKLKLEKAILEEKVKERTAEVMQKNAELAFKNKNITDSIRYAKRIQDAILPSAREIAMNLPESFVLYKPKDIVSGDFYWFEKVHDQILVAVVDCTGHGVPGAFMSIVGYNGLNRTVREFGLLQPGEIMDKLNQLVIETLQHSENSEVRDGMDMSICSYFPKQRKLEYAGANNPLYVVIPDYRKLEENGMELEIALLKDGLKLYEIKATKQPIGPYYDQKPFENHLFHFEKGDSVYMFSDGFPDQFGGPKGKKFMYHRFKELLLSVQGLNMVDQKTVFDQTIEKWKGELEQIDDICLIGIKI